MATKFMNNFLIHSAQKLSNSGYGIIEVDGKLLNDESQDIEKGQQLIYEMSRLFLNGKKEEVNDKVTIYYRGKKFVIKTVTVDTDIVGRRSPILSYGRFNNSKDNNWISSISADITRFTVEIGRNSDEDISEGIEYGLSRICQRKKVINRVETTATLVIPPLAFAIPTLTQNPHPNSGGVILWILGTVFWTFAISQIKLHLLKARD